MCKTALDLAAVIQDAADVCAPTVEKSGQRLTIETPGAPYRLMGDNARLQQVLWNLIQNASKFSPDGGEIRIHGRHTGNSIVVAVSDTGIGIDPRALPRLFDPFEQGDTQTTRRFGGLGLGLAISKALVTMHGGTISADSAGKGKGATFTVELPLATAAAEPLPPVPAVPPETRDEAPAATRPAQRILVVEDHPDTAFLMRRFLSAAGHEVRVVHSVAAALNAAQEAGDLDLLISDMGLPDGSGLTLLRELRHAATRCARSP